MYSDLIVPILQTLLDILVLDGENALHDIISVGAEGARQFSAPVGLGAAHLAGEVVETHVTFVRSVRQNAKLLLECQHASMKGCDFVFFLL